VLLDDENEVAVDLFVDIMRYMGDYPTSRNAKSGDLGRTAVKRVLDCSGAGIRDEAYCQIMKQLTQNKSIKA
jgi:hypothetical protein